jgi:hypothetical protein
MRRRYEEVIQDILATTERISIDELVSLFLVSMNQILDKKDGSHILGTVVCNHEQGGISFFWDCEDTDLARKLAVIIKDHREEQHGKEIEIKFEKNYPGSNKKVH